MVKYTLKDGEYTFNATAKTITLIPPWNALNWSQILSIRNLTVNEQFYDCNSSRYTISVSGAVITHTYDNSYHNNTDKLQIVIDTELTPSDRDNILFENTSIPAGEAVFSDWFDISGYDKLWLYLSSIMNFTWMAQFTDDDGANAENAGFDVCNSTGTALTYTTVGKGSPVVAEKKAIPLVDIRGRKMRIQAKNNGASAEIPYCAVI